MPADLLWCFNYHQGAGSITNALISLFLKTKLTEQLLTAIDYAAKNSTSLNAVKELLGSCFGVVLVACCDVADKFELSDEAVTALADFKRCERERYELLKKTEMDGADEKRQEGVQLLGT